MSSSSNLQFSSAAILEEPFETHKPRLSFDAAVNEWRTWRGRLLPELWERFGPFPDKAAPLKPKIVSTQAFDTFTHHKLIYSSREDVPIPAHLLIPHGITGKTPAVLCIHGHVRSGKEDVAFGAGEYGVPYGRALAERGVITLCPDNAGMGERAHPSGGCDFLWRRLNLLGYDLTGYRVYDLMRGVDYLRSLPEVDGDRIGSAGLSGGCWLGMVHAALDDRVKAAVLSGFFTTFAQTSWVGHCICHHPKGIGEVCEMPDIAGLIAPRPIFVEWGTEDTSRPVHPAFEMARKIYRAAGAAESIALHEFEGGHLFSGEKSLPWLVRSLRGDQLSG